MKRLNLLIALFLIHSISWSQEKEVTITIDTLTSEVYMLTGEGGNIGLYVNDTNSFMIDDQFARLSPKIKKAVASITDKPLRYLFNTHMHGDHTGGNAEFNSSTTTLIAQDNVRKDLLKRLKEKPELGSEILPEISFSEELNIFEADETIMAFHVHNAHTDSDAMIYFMKNNVLHMGDTYFSERYPYMDLKNGGSLNGYIDAIKRALMLIDDKTIIIPGHGRSSNKLELIAYVDMLETIKENILKAIASGDTLEEVEKNSSISSKYDNNFGTGFISPERMRTIFYTSLKNDF
ncbi:MBL fold metallo-hydrolase [Maribacter sp. BPC-D8]|uniref:MBL fold metallo-hydrolase n=1 Tax=Maribacter sp. BPC-D8 TaxID=3053613 RepID=UPI002B4682BB|nr:MBL fold metallo-hydrolase [Maribacter sp. BPC-D8]WRI28160.1 MBL fold metallo-hydrolase [Maribacter sp. BPC-D8]